MKKNPKFSNLGVCQASHLIEESERAIGALNEALSDLKKAGREEYQIVNLKSIVNGNYYLTLQKGNDGF